MALTTEDLTAIQLIVRGETEPIRADMELFARATNEQFIIIDARFDAVDARFDAVDARFDRIEFRLDKVEFRLDKIESRLDMVETSLETVVSEVGEMNNTLQFHHLEPRAGKKS